MSRALRLTIAAACTAAVIVAAIVWAQGRSGVRRFVEPTVIEADADAAQLQAQGHDGISIPAAVGQPVSFGQLVLTNMASDPIIIDSIEVTDIEPQLDYLGVKIAPDQDREVYAIPAGYGDFPWGGMKHYVDVAGTVVPPHDSGGDRGVDVLVGVKANVAGRWTMQGLTVTYTLNDQQYRSTYDNYYTICTDPGPCAPKKLHDVGT